MGRASQQSLCRSHIEVGARNPTEHEVLGSCVTTNAAEVKQQCPSDLSTLSATPPCQPLHYWTPYTVVRETVKRFCRKVESSDFLGIYKDL